MGEEILHVAEVRTSMKLSLRIAPLKLREGKSDTSLKTATQAKFSMNFVTMTLGFPQRNKVHEERSIRTSSL